MRLTNIDRILMSYDHKHIYQQMGKREMERVKNGLTFFSQIGVNDYPWKFVEHRGKTYLRRDITTNLESVKSDFMSGLKYIIGSSDHPSSNIYLDADNKPFSLYVDCNTNYEFKINYAISKKSWNEIKTLLDSNGITNSTFIKRLNDLMVL